MKDTKRLNQQIILQETENRKEGELQGDEVYDDERVSNFEPGVFKYLAPGEAVSVPQVYAPDGQFEPFLLYCAMRGMEQAMMDLIVEPEIAEAALGHIFDYHYALNERTFEIGGGRIDVTYVAEDLGGQTARAR